MLEPTPDKLTRMGMARTFQNIRLWKSMTVFDNVLIAKHLRRSGNMFTAMFRLNARRRRGSAPRCWSCCGWWAWRT